MTPTSPGEGYLYLRASRCKGCGATMYWWLTPRDKQSPHDLDGTTHFATCPKAASFKRATPPRSKP